MKKVWYFGRRGDGREGLVVRYGRDEDAPFGEPLNPEKLREPRYDWGTSGDAVDCLAYALLLDVGSDHILSAAYNKQFAEECLSKLDRGYFRLDEDDIIAFVVNAAADDMEFHHTFRTDRRLT